MVFALTLGSFPMPRDPRGRLQEWDHGLVGQQDIVASEIRYEEMMTSATCPNPRKIP